MSARTNAREAARAAYKRLPESMRGAVRRTRIGLTGIGQMKVNQALLAKRLSDIERGVGPGGAPTEPVPDPRFPDTVRSRLCTQEQLSEPWFAKWCEALAMPENANRKVWEFAYIGHVLDALGMLEPGRRGVGFGVGREPLVSGFASRGVEVLGTDLGAEQSAALGWVRSNQHSSAVENMLLPEVCSPEQFHRLVSWRPVDMRNIPDDLRGFDFCWSACALEHLGSLDNGLEFVERSLATLRPGGIAVHTTEFNVASNDETLEVGPTVVYRERDLTPFVARLEAAGHQVAALDYRRGTGVLDEYVDVPPYSPEAALRFLLGTYTLTSIALVIRTPPA